MSKRGIDNRSVQVAHRVLELPKACNDRVASRHVAHKRGDTKPPSVATLPACQNGVFGPTARSRKNRINIGIDNPQKMGNQ